MEQHMNRTDGKINVRPGGILNDAAYAASTSPRHYTDLGATCHPTCFPIVSRIGKRHWAVRVGDLKL
jgi:hypothetical protein